MESSFAGAQCTRWETAVKKIFQPLGMERGRENGNVPERPTEEPPRPSQESTAKKNSAKERGDSSAKWFATAVESRCVGKKKKMPPRLHFCEDLGDNRVCNNLLDPTLSEKLLQVKAIPGTRRTLPAGGCKKTGDKLSRGEGLPKRATA
jgi:hypothetical protein